MTIKKKKTTRFIRQHIQPEHWLNMLSGEIHMFNTLCIFSTYLLLAFRILISNIIYIY